MAAEQWRVVTEPVGQNPGLKSKALAKVGRTRKTKDMGQEKTHDNIGGIVVYLQMGYTKHEFARVGWVRATSENPNVSFKEKINEVIDDAQTSVEVLNKCRVDGELV